MSSTRIHWWIPCAAVIVAAYATVSLLLDPGYAASCFGNVVQSGLLFLLTSLMVANASRNQGRVRYFWALMAAGSGLWLAATLLWVWYEDILRQEVPLSFLGDVLFFIHIVPMMAALGARPHVRQTRRNEFGSLDFTLLLLWWVYLYCFVVIPWQYVVPDVSHYGVNFSLLYLIENLVLLAGLVLLTFRVRRPWRGVYALLLLGATVYTVGSQIVNHLIESGGGYYTGSIYDLPLVTAMTVFVGVALYAMHKHPKPQQEEPSRWQSLLLSRLAMVAVLSLPFILGWGIVAGDVPHKVVLYRLFLTLIAMVVMPFIVFLKQHLLDRELMTLLGASQQNYENLKRLQAQLIQAERLAALSQFIAGAAHQINNPLTAVIGYSDLLEQDCGPDDERSSWAKKIGQQARRTQELVKNLLSFSKQTHSEKAPLDLNSLVANAVQLRALDLKDDRIRIVQHLDSHLPKVLADGNQLLQVCFHIIGNAMDAMKKQGGELTVSTRVQGERATVEFSDTGPGISDPTKIFDPFYTTKPVGAAAGLGLSACYGIVSEHGGTIVCQNRPEGGATFIVQLPAGVTSDSSTDHVRVSAVAK